MPKMKKRNNLRRVIRVRTWILLGLDFVILFSGLYTGERLLFYAFTLLTSVLLYSALINFWVLMDFNYLHTIDKKVASKGETVEMIIEIHNDKPFLFPRIRVFYETPTSIMEGIEKEIAISLLPFQHKKITEKFVCSLRGNYEIGMKRAVVTDLFGLFVFEMNLLRRSYHHTLNLVVTPRILHINYIPLPQMREETSARKDMKGTEELASVSDLRKYRYGDSMKKIHWKMTSKMQEILVKNYETNTMPEAILYVDTMPYPIEGITRFEVEDHFVDCATALTGYILEHNLPYRLVCHQKKRTEIQGRTMQDFDRFFEYLAYMPFEGDFPIDTIINLESRDLTRRKIIMILTHSVSNELFNRASILQKQGVQVFLFILPHADYMDGSEYTIAGKLAENGVTSYIIATGQRIDRVLEVAGG